ncbi:MAG TPA: serine/threonine-protein kinase [Kofleriaceae bacterium]
MLPQRPAADAGISIGQVFLGKYRVDAVLGHGGMGVVAKCTHLGLNEQVAIKMLRQDVLLDRDAVERFMREAQAASKLKSEHVARVVDVGVFEPTGVPYMVMEFLDGHDLGELIDQQKTIPAPWASLLVLQAAEALAEAHSINIVHRDVKPTNLFVTWRPDGTAIVKVLDFGISKAPMGTDMQLTQTQSLLGTPAYMSPEQMRSARLVDARSDIWSLGTVLYELLEGRRPFEAESFSEMCVKVAVDPPAEMVNAPPALRPVVMRCLAKTPEQRFANMAELGRALVPFTQDQHHANMLVERMQRVLGRLRPQNTGEWDGSTPSRVQPLRASSPALPQFRPSDAGMSFPNTPARGVPLETFSDQKTTREKSVPIQMPTEFSRKRSKLPWIVLACCVLIGTGVGIVIATNSDDAIATAPPSQPAIETATPDPAPVPVADPKPAPTPPDPAPVASGSATETKDGTEAKAAAAIPTPPKPPPRTAKKPPKTVKQPPAVSKEKPKDEPKVVPPPPPKPKCSPWDHAHATDCKK